MPIGDKDRYTDWTLELIFSGEATKLIELIAFGTIL